MKFLVTCFSSSRQQLRNCLKITYNRLFSHHKKLFISNRFPSVLYKLAETMFGEVFYIYIYIYIYITFYICWWNIIWKDYSKYCRTYFSPHLIITLLLVRNEIHKAFLIVYNMDKQTQPHSTTLVCICVVRMLLFVLFCCYLCVSMYCLCVTVYCHLVTTQFRLINISNIH
jgi:hypothetical protein